MTLSVTPPNNNALIALANLNSTDGQAASVQNQTGAGGPTSSTTDAAAAVLGLQSAGTNISPLASVQLSLDRASSISDTASAAGQSIIDLLSQLKAKIAAGTDTSLSSSARASLNSDYQSLLGQIGGLVNGASFDGTNILDGSQPNGLKVLVGGDANATVTLSAANLSVGGSVIVLPASSSIGTATAASALLTQVNQSLTNVGGVLSALSAQSNEIAAHSGFVGLLSDALATGAGGLVNADLSAESAKLQALQVRQQLSGQSLSIANQSPQVILSLFK